MNMMHSTKATELVKYQNGNTFVTILSDGTKIREYEDIPVIEFPESIDLKITNYCNLGCLYCHEKSTTKGLHSDVNVILYTLKDLPAGVELAIGGGNPLSHPDLLYLLINLKERGFICNITVNQAHINNPFLIFLLKSRLINGLGISITNNNFKHIKSFLEITDNIVYHLIAGVNNIEIIDELIKLGKCKILILGYKIYGFGKTFYSNTVKETLDRWEKLLPKYLTKYTVSFDNLAIEQLNVRKLFTKEGWDEFYMGDDFTFTMYIDGVDQVYAPTSRNPTKISFNEISLLNYFKQYRQCL